MACKYNRKCALKQRGKEESWGGTRCVWLVYTCVTIIKHVVLTYEPLLVAELKRLGCVKAGEGDEMKASVHRVVYTNDADEPAECNGER